MKNFTNNFKQFTSRLSARWLIMALMMLVGTSSAWATIDVYPGETIIIDVSSHGWFNNDNCYPKLYCGNTVIGQASGYDSDQKYEITLTITSVVNGTLHVSRCNSNGEYNKQYIDDRSSSKINTFQITGDGNGKWNTTQSSTNIYYLRGLGDFDKWNNIKTPYTIYLNKGEYEFKVYDSNDNWYGNNGTMTRDNCSGWTMSTNEGNCGITADVAGDYTFTFVASTKKLTVTYPELPCYTTSDVDPGTISSNATNNTICGSGSVELTLSNTTTKDDLTRTIQWQKYIGNAWSNITNATSTTYTETISATTKYRAKVTWTKSECTTLTEYASESGFTITVKARPDAPTFDAIPAQCGSYTLPAEDKNQVNVNWYTAATGGEKITSSVTTTGTYHAEAVDGTCISASRTPVQITIKTKPTINISGSEEAVLYEDVVLTAATDGTSISWEITEGDGSLSSTTGNSVTLTSSSADNVTVTATATLGNCTATDTHEVEFSAENCADVPSNDIQITFKTPSNNGNNGQYWGIGSLYYKKDNGASYTEVKLYENDNCQGGEQTSQEVTISNLQNNATVYFKACYDYGGYTATTKKLTLTKGNKYIIGIITNQNPSSTNSTNKTSEVGIEVTSEVSLTHDPEITAPAAKTISVSTTDGEGNIIFSGQVVKTGCADALTYGFAYSTDANADKNNWTKVECANTGNTAGIQYNGEKTGIEEDGTYYVCAYITNSAGTSYGAVTEITVSTEKEPITKVTLTHVRNQAGDPYSEQELENLIYCVGDIVWFKLEQDGSNFQYYEWISYPGTGLEGMYYGGMFKLKITRSGNVGIHLRNDANVDGEGNPTWIESNLLMFNTHLEPAVPYISINPASGVLCEGNTATITVTNPSTDCAYKLVEEGSKAGFTDYESGDLTYTVGSVGKYYVAAQHIACRANEYTSNQVEINQIISTSASISIEPANPETTPWEPVTITVNPEEGYVYELSYTDNNLAGVAGVIIKQNGESYTYYIPRPNSWGTGDGARDAIQYGIKATLKVEGEATQCQMSETTATITLKDEDNENCPQ